ncbi:UNVERIFIED_CONTAM: hypothetical protein HDU68_005846, partial [Siphonaria sp. JEL0065]
MDALAELLKELDSRRARLFSAEMVLASVDDDADEDDAIAIDCVVAEAVVAGDEGGGRDILPESGDEVIGILRPPAVGGDKEEEDEGNVCGGPDSRLMGDWIPPSVLGGDEVAGFDDG